MTKYLIFILILFAGVSTSRAGNKPSFRNSSPLGVEYPESPCFQAHIEDKPAPSFHRKEIPGSGSGQCSSSPERLRNDGTQYDSIPLTLEQAIQEALENNYNIKIARNEAQIVNNNNTLGNAGFLPEVTAEYNKNFSNQSTDQVRSTNEKISVSGIKNEQESYGVALNWTIFDGFKMFTSYNQLEAMQQMSEAQLKAEIDALIYSLTTAYYEAALEKERLALFNSNIELSEARLKVAKDKYELGRASKLEYLQAQVDLNADKSSQIQQQQILSAKKLELLRLMASEQELNAIILSFTLTSDATLEVSSLIAQAEANNATLSALKRQQTVAKHAEKLSRGDLFPQIDLFAGYERSNGKSPVGFVIENQTNQTYYGLSASWKLFNGFNTRREMQNAKINYENTGYAYENELLNYTSSIKSSYINYSNNLSLLKLESENLEVARENNAIAQERYKIGLSNALELREAQTNLINAELRRQNAAFSVKFAEIELNYLAGISLL